MSLDCMTWLVVFSTMGSDSIVFHKKTNKEIDNDKII